GRTPGARPGRRFRLATDLRRWWLAAGERLSRRAVHLVPRDRPGLRPLRRHPGASDQRHHSPPPLATAVWYHTYGMRKTTVYLSDEEVEALRQLSAATGVSQAELIRGAIRQAVAQLPRRRFRSLGQGEGTAERTSTPRWTAAEVYDKAFGER